MNIVQKSKEKALKGIALTEKEIIELLEIPLGSIEDKELRAVAREVAQIKTNNTAYIWSAIGADYATCPMNCKFCSFGEEWEIIKKDFNNSMKNKQNNYVYQEEDFNVEDLLKISNNSEEIVKNDIDNLFAEIVEYK